MKKSIFFIISLLFTYSVNSQSIEKLLDEAKKVVYDDSCIFLKYFNASFPAKDANAKISIILNKNTQYHIYLFKSSASGEAELSIENKNVAGIPTVIVPAGKNYSSIYFATKVEGVYQLFLKNKSDNQQNLIGVLSIPKQKIKASYYSTCPDANNKGHFNVTSISDTAAYTMVDEMPQFVIGDDMAFMKWFSQNFKYPEKAKKLGIHGIVFTQFVVDKQGKMRDFKTIRGLENEIDETIINTLKTAPTWQKPGKQKGKNVNVIFTFPVKLDLK